MSKIKSVKHVKSCWVSATRLVSKPWGEERCWAGVAGVDGKILYMKQGHRNSLKYNHLKDECLLVLEGEVEVEYGDELSLKDPVMHPFKKSVISFGECFNIQSGCPYRILALTDSQVIEIGTAGGPTNSTFVRIEDDYGRE